MSADEPTIEVDGLAFAIPPAGLDALLRGAGVSIRLSSVNVHVSETALNALLARMTPAGQPEPTRARLSDQGVTLDHHDGERSLRLDLTISAFRIQVRDGRLSVTSE